MNNKPLTRQPAEERFFCSVPLFVPDSSDKMSGHPHRARKDDSI